MSWITEWEMISNRIRGLERAAHFYQGFMRQDHNAADRDTLLPQSIELFRLIKSFGSSYKNTLSHAAQQSIDDFLYNTRYLSSSMQSDPFSFIAIITKILSFQAEFDYIISDSQHKVRSIVERAFIHLQRSIIADSRFQSIWETALIQGETRCERLGAAHMLSHGIWAFKVSEAGERTDLVMNEPLSVDQVERTSEGLVLTEWKVVRNPSEAETKAQQALRQAKLYSQGVLGGVELKGVRYLVLVSEDRLDQINDLKEDEVTYRHINIAVDPNPPSQSKVKPK